MHRTLKNASKKFCGGLEPSRLALRKRDEGWNFEYNSIKFCFCAGVKQRLKNMQESVTVKSTMKQQWKKKTKLAIVNKDGHIFTNWYFLSAFVLKNMYFKSVRNFLFRICPMIRITPSLCIFPIQRKYHLYILVKWLGAGFGRSWNARGVLWGAGTREGQIRGSLGW